MDECENENTEDTLRIQQSSLKFPSSLGSRWRDAAREVSEVSKGLPLHLSSFVWLSGATISASCLESLLGIHLTG